MKMPGILIGTSNYIFGQNDLFIKRKQDGIRLSQMFWVIAAPPVTATLTFWGVIHQFSVHYT